MNFQSNINNNLPFADEVTAEYAYKILSSEQNCFLVDVRTENEWNNIGVPLLPDNSRLIKLSWRLSHNMAVNQKFSEELSTKITDKEAKIFFLCKVGGRSFEAAAHFTSLGYENCYNIAAGFEAASSDGAIKGWLAEHLPVSKS